MKTIDAVQAFNQTHQNTRIHLHDNTENMKVLVLEGELDLRSSNSLIQLLGPLIGSIDSGSTLVLDLESVYYISSTGVGFLTQTLMETGKKNINLKLRHMNPRVESILHLLGVYSFFTTE